MSPPSWISSAFLTASPSRSTSMPPPEGLTSTGLMIPGAISDTFVAPSPNPSPTTTDVIIYGTYRTPTTPFVTYPMPTVVFTGPYTAQNPTANVYTAPASQATTTPVISINDHAKHYSPGAVAGISIGTLIVGALLSALLTVLVLRRKNRRQKERDMKNGVWVAELAREGKDEREMRERAMEVGVEQDVPRDVAGDLERAGRLVGG